MPVCNQHKIIFIHVPKTAGTTIEDALNLFQVNNLYDKHGKLHNQSVTRQHLYGSEILEQCKINPKDYYIFSVVRNPYDRLVSAFHFIQNQRNLYIPEKIKQMSFDNFIRCGFKMDKFERRYIFDGHLELQTNYLDIDNINIFKFENLQECFDMLSARFNIDNFKHCLKCTVRKPWEEYYTPELKELVYNFYKEDFDRFKYP